MTRNITEHQSGIGEINDKITIVAGPCNGGGNTPSSYLVKLSPNLTLTLPFQTGPTSMGLHGLTNEVLLAVVLDRVRCLQDGPMNCIEYEAAYRHIVDALIMLQRRIRNRRSKEMTNMEKQEGPTGATTESAGPMGANGPTGPAGVAVRVSKNETHLRLSSPSGNAGNNISLDSLQTWSGWQQVEGVVRNLHLYPLTETELDVIKSCAIRPAGKNGLAEFLSALSSMR